MLIETFNCPNCTKEIGITEALSLQRKPRQLDETCIIQCPKCSTKFEITARQLPEEKPEEKAPEEAPPEEKPAEATPEQTTTPEEKKESVEVAGAQVLMCESCQATRLALKESKFMACHTCQGKMKLSNETPGERLNECYRMVDSGVSPDKALSLFLGERL